MKYDPYDYQKYATNFIEEKTISAVFLSMGLGKTVITLSAFIYNNLFFNPLNFMTCFNCFELNTFLIQYQLFHYTTMSRLIA